MHGCIGASRHAPFSLKLWSGWPVAPPSCRLLRARGLVPRRSGGRGEGGMPLGTGRDREPETTGVRNGLNGICRSPEREAVFPVHTYI
eukprot:595661-Pyramimonas_sp.AAC.1